MKTLNTSLRAARGGAKHYKHWISAFTLAETLITIGIIGIIAAMTLPAIIDQRQKVVTVNRLKKFYTTMEQAILLTEKDNGELENWMPPADAIRSSDGFEKWFDLYLGKHFKIVQRKKLDSGQYQVGLADGSGFVAYAASSTVVYFFFCVDLKYCGSEKYDGKNSFLFEIGKDTKANNRIRFVTSNIGAQYKSREKLLESCKYGDYDNPGTSSKDRRHYCARLIQYDGWQIKKDYPWNQIIVTPEEED